MFEIGLSYTLEEIRAAAKIVHMFEVLEEVQNKECAQVQYKK
jgi:hypothetical protein